MVAERIAARTEQRWNSPARPAGSALRRPAERRNVANPGPPVVRRARQMTWRSPMTAAVLAGTFLVTLLCCYVYAYAQVTAASFALSTLKRDLHKAEQEEQALRAEVSRLNLPVSVEQRAATLGLVATPDEAQAQVLTLTPRAPRAAVAVTQNAR